MTAPEQLDELVADYLERLRTSLLVAGCDASRRADIVDEIAAHIREARSEYLAEDEASVRALLDRMGAPEEIAAEAAADGIGAGTSGGALVLASGLGAGASAADAKRRRFRPRRWQLEVAGALAAIGTIIGLAVSLPGPSRAPLFSATAFRAAVTNCPAMTYSRVVTVPAPAKTTGGKGSTTSHRSVTRSVAHPVTIHAVNCPLIIAPSGRVVHFQRFHPVKVKVVAPPKKVQVKAFKTVKAVVLPQASFTVVRVGQHQATLVRLGSSSAH